MGLSGRGLALQPVHLHLVQGSLDLFHVYAEAGEDSPSVMVWKYILPLYRPYPATVRARTWKT